MKVVLILSTIFLLSACEDASRQVQVKKDTTGVVHTSVDTSTKYYSQTAKLIGLDVPTVKDSFVLRLWISSMAKLDRMIELRKSGKDWSTRKFNYEFEPNDKLVVGEVPVEFISTLEPMIDSLRRVDFNNLLSQEQVEGFQDNVADGVTYHMEVFQFDRYKMLTYHCPETYYSKEVNNKRFVDLLMLLNKHFTFYSPICKRG